MSTLTYDNVIREFWGKNKEVANYKPEIEVLVRSICGAAEELGYPLPPEVSFIIGASISSAFTMGLEHASRMDFIVWLHKQFNQKTSINWPTREL